MQAYKLIVKATSISILLCSTKTLALDKASEPSLLADTKGQSLAMPDASFLEFLADTVVVDEEMTDPLDMLELNGPDMGLEQDLDLEQDMDLTGNEQTSPTSKEEK